MKDPYSILKVPSSASEADIKKAYRTMAKELHPDRHPGDDVIADKFKEVSAAYALLSDKEMRARYDRGEINADGSEKGFGGFGGGGGFGQKGGRRGGGGFGGFGADFDPEEIFSSFFGQGGPGRRTRSQKGSDRIYKLDIDFLDAVQGSKRKVTLENGKTLNVTIPTNVKEGQQIRLKGQGGEGTGGAPAGDALVEVHIKPHKFFKSEGDDIMLDLPISLQEAILGGKVTVPTIHGSVALNIPKGSNSGKTMRLKGKGIQNPKSKTSGDQYVKLMIMIPDNAGDDLEKIIEEWAEDRNDDVRSKLV